MGLLATVRAEGEGGHRVALVIGNGSYKGMTRLDNPPRDASAIGKKLTGLGFTVTVKQDQGKAELEQAVELFSRQSAGAELSLLFYAGHGIQVDGRNYLIPVDAEPPEDDAGIHRQAVELEWVVSRMRRSAQVALIFMDACRSNPGLVTRLRGNSRDILRDVRLADVPRGKILVLYAAGPGQKARDGKPGANSPFAQALLAHLDEREPVQHLVTLVSGDVERLTGGMQEPENQGTLNRLLYLAGRCQEGSHWQEGQCRPDISAECPKGTRLEKARGCIPDINRNCPGGMSFVEGQGCLPLMSAALPLPPCKFIKVTETQIELLQPILFLSNMAQIRPLSFDVLDEVAAVLKSRPAMKLHITAHTDPIGPLDKNIQLSAERAKSVRMYLIESGVEAPRLTWEGAGPTRPRCRENTVECREKNRRIEFAIFPQLLQSKKGKSIGLLGVVGRNEQRELAKRLTESLHKVIGTFSSVHAEVARQDLEEIGIVFGCADDNFLCWSRVGKSLGVKLLIYGNVQNQANRGQIDITLYLLNVEAGNIQEVIKEPLSVGDLVVGSAALERSTQRWLRVLLNEGPR